MSSTEIPAAARKSSIILDSNISTEGEDSISTHSNISTEEEGFYTDTESNSSHPSSIVELDTVSGYRCGDPICLVPTCRAQVAEVDGRIMSLFLYHSPGRTPRKWFIKFEFGFYSFHKDLHLHHILLEKNNGQRQYEFYCVEYSEWLPCIPSYGLHYGAFEESGFAILRIVGLRDEECRALKHMIRVAHDIAQQNGLDSPIPAQYLN